MSIAITVSNCTKVPCKFEESISVNMLAEIVYSLIIDSFITPIHPLVYLLIHTRLNHPS